MSKVKRPTERPTEDITFNEWVAELARVRKPKTEAPGLTMEEISQRLGRDIRYARVMVKRAIVAGLCEFIGHMKPVTGIDGRIYYAPSYRFRRAPGGKGKQGKR